MKTFIILLRGINVSGKNKLPMIDLRNLLNELGFKNVKTYIQSGNIILESEIEKREISELITQEINKRFGYHVPAIVKTKDELKHAVESYPFSKENEKIVGFAFLEKITEIQNIEIKNIGSDEYTIDNDVVYFYCPNGFGKSKLTNNLFEKKLNVTATTRNLRTTLKLIELST